MDTILLNPDSWDMEVDASGNIAMAADPYAQAQDIASACRTFKGEVYYNGDLGVPYFQQILGQVPSLQTINAEMEKAAITVPGIVDVVCKTQKAQGRGITGEIQATNTAGVPIQVSLS